MLHEAYDIFLETLSNKTRLSIINSLLEKPKNVTQLTEETDFDQSTISHNLRRLKACGFVTNERNGKFKIYSLNKETIEPLLKLMNTHINKYCKRLCLCDDDERKRLLGR